MDITRDMAKSEIFTNDCMVSFRYFLNNMYVYISSIYGSQN